jgi:hypothetical protein
MEFYFKFDNMKQYSTQRTPWTEAKSISVFIKLKTIFKRNL